MGKRYLVLPVDDNKEKKHYRLTREGRLLYDFTAALDPDAPAMRTYIDVTRFGDGALTLTDDAGTPVTFAETSRIPPRGERENGMLFRPRVHFTTEIGWTNDPNGLLYAGGVYHLFYQHNPHGTDWGNMTWGHAVSSDLVTWEEWGDALFPDEMGTMYSGSAILDTENRAGFGKDAILLFYTAAGGTSELSAGQPFTQCLAFSTDGGRTFTKYDHNPILPQQAPGNRDPKVEWSPELGRYLMALYLEGHTYAVFASDDLRHWEKFAEIPLPEDDECPDLYPLPAEGTVRWVFSGAHDTYLVGRIDAAGFHPSQEPLRCGFGDCTAYAAQTFSGCAVQTFPGGAAPGLPGAAGRRIRMSWVKSVPSGAVFRSQMGIPCEMTLRRAGGLLRLGAYPVRETESLVRRRFGVREVTQAGETVLADADALSGCAADVTLEIGEGCAPFVLSCFGIEIGVFPEEGRVVCPNGAAPLSYTGEKRLRVLFDTLGAEIFADGGLICMAAAQNADFGQGAVLRAQEGVRVRASACALG